jgi:DNA invertase Pin-like site-specific DNA recombinase
MIYGYARVSTEGQDLSAQLERLTSAGCGQVFYEKRSGKDAQRPRLKAMLRQLRQGDLGSGLINHSQKMTAAAMQIAEKKVWAQRS